MAIQYVGKNHSSVSESHGALHVCNKCGWSFQNPRPSAKHRRSHKKICGTIQGYQKRDAPVDEHKSPFAQVPNVMESCNLESIICGAMSNESEDEVFSDAAMEFGDGGFGLDGISKSEEIDLTATVFFEDCDDTCDGFTLPGDDMVNEDADAERGCGGGEMTGVKPERNVMDLENAVIKPAGFKDVDTVKRPQSEALLDSDDEMIFNEEESVEGMVKEELVEWIADVIQFDEGSDDAFGAFLDAGAIENKGPEMCSLEEKLSVHVSPDDLPNVNPTVSHARVMYIPESARTGVFDAAEDVSTSRVDNAHYYLKNSFAASNEPRNHSSPSRDVKTCATDNIKGNELEKISQDKLKKGKKVVAVVTKFGSILGHKSMTSRREKREVKGSRPWAQFVCCCSCR